MKNYKLLRGCFDNFYVAKELKNGLMSSDRFTITTSMVIQMFEQYAKDTCINKHCSTFCVTDGNGNEIMEVKVKGDLLKTIKEELKTNK